MVDNKKIQAILKKHYEYLEHRGFLVLGVFLYGSQNYELDSETSDVDTIGIIIPTFDDLYNNTMVSATYSFPYSKDKCNYKDIRAFLGLLKKSNPNILEVLFTKYSIINEKYTQLLERIFLNRELIARYDKDKFINAAFGQFTSYYKKLSKMVTGDRQKELAEMLRLRELIKTYIADELPYEEMLVPKKAAQLRAIKFGDVKLSSAELLSVIEEAYNEVKEKVDNYSAARNSENQMFINNLIYDVGYRIVSLESINCLIKKYN